MRHSIKTLLRGGLHIAMVTIFLLSANQSFQRFLRQDKSVFVTFSDIEKVQYPSITICKRRAFDEQIDALVHDDATKPEEIEKAMKDNVTKKEDIFYFVSHPNMTESEHPCLTTGNSLDPGKPCMFPFNSTEGLQFSCAPLYFELGWCGTKLTPQATGPNDWGYCSKYCKDENLISNGKGDLTQEDIFWESRFYDLRSWEEGYCYTYNPPEKSMVGVSQGIGIFFKHIRAGTFLSYSIYLHEKGQFWPGTELQPIGQTEKIILEENMDISCKFKTKFKEKIRRESEKCERDVDYKFTDCISKFIATTVGCTTNWISYNVGSNLKTCSNSTEIQKFKELMINLKEKPFQQLSKTTKCLPKCSVTAYSFNLKKTKIKEKGPRNWTSAFFLHSSNLSPLTAIEYIPYDFTELTSDVGGYLGLFLGWSILYMGLQGPKVFLKFARQTYYSTLDIFAKTKQIT